MQLSASLATLLFLVAVSTASVADNEGLRLKKFKCKLNDNACLKNFLQTDIIGSFSNGFPDFGVKSFDPLHFDLLSFSYDSDPAVGITLNQTNANLYGLAGTKVLDVRTETVDSSFTLDAYVYIPNLLFEGSYVLKGKRLLFPINWHGKFNMTLGYVTDSWKLSANLVQKGKDVFLELDKLSVNPRVNTFNAYASGLFGNMEEIGKLALTFTNKYWPVFFDVMWKLAEPDLVSTVSVAVSNILSKTPVTGLTPKQFLSASYSNFVDNGLLFAADPSSSNIDTFQF